MEKIKKRITNLKVAGKLKVYRMTVLVMTLFLVLVALISTLVIRLNIEKITEVWSPSLEYLQDLETMTAKYRIKQYQHLVESDAAVMNSCEEEITKLESQIEDTGAKLDAIISAELASSNFNMRAFGERVARNMPIQGTAADIIKIAMVHVRNRLKAEKLDAKLILQVHDELIVECPEAESDTVKKILEEEMANAVQLSVPMLAEAGSGKSWYQAKG